MKHILFTAFLTALVSSLALAQTEQSSKFIGGTFEIITVSSGGSTSSRFQLGPRVGYFIKDQWAVGSGLELSIDVYREGDTDVAFDISPFTRYYFPVVENKFFLFGEARFGLTFNNDRTSFRFAATPGFAFFPTERWAVELGFQLLSLSVRPDGNGDPITTFRFGTNTLSPSLGVYFFF